MRKPHLLISFEIYGRHSMLGISLLQYLHRQSQGVWPGLSVGQFLEELRQIQQFILLYPPLGDKGPNRVATVLSKQTLAQQARRIAWIGTAL